jgi:predicted phosphoribosyltransferase
VDPSQRRTGRGPTALADAGARDWVLCPSRLRDRRRVFRDRADAGAILASLVSPWVDRDGLVIAVGSGSVPVAAEIAYRHGLPLDAAAVVDLSAPASRTAVYGAVAFDGTLRLEDGLLEELALPRAAIEQAVTSAFHRVAALTELLRGDQEPPELRDRVVILVSDGFASVPALRAAMGAVRGGGAAGTVLAIAAGRRGDVRRLAREADCTCCANLHWSFAFEPAQAYADCRRVDEPRAAALLAARWLGAEGDAGDRVVACGRVVS